MALTFDGSTDYLSCTTMGSFGSGIETTDATFCCWLKTTTTTTMRVFGTYDGSNQIWQLQLNTSPNNTSNQQGHLRMFCRDVDGSGNNLQFGVASDQGYTDGAWHSLVMSFDGPANTGYLWVDGASQAVSYNNQGTPDNWNDWAYAMLVGGVNAGGTPTPEYVGSLFDVRFYSRLFNDADAAAYHYGRGSDWILDSLVARYLLAEGPTGSAASGTVEDLSGNDYDATVSGTPDWLAAPFSPLLRGVQWD